MEHGNGHARRLDTMVNASRTEWTQRKEESQGQGRSMSQRQKRKKKKKKKREKRTTMCRVKGEQTRVSGNGKSRHSTHAGCEQGFHGSLAGVGKGFVFTWFSQVLTRVCQCLRKCALGTTLLWLTILQQSENTRGQRQGGFADTHGKRTAQRSGGQGAPFQHTHPLTQTHTHTRTHESATDTPAAGGNALCGQESLFSMPQP